eukprot:m.116084 g.116084  ORF g.116084 m.116084 type:complete len:564 (+) comp16063_c0_seq2:99-1790(+)
MDVTRDNFYEALELFNNLLPTALCAGLDTEFTGLTVEESKAHGYESLEERYARNRDAGRAFLIIQCGICLVHWDDEAKKYLARSFNFNIFPRQAHKAHPDTRFLVQASSIEYLIQNGTDFQKIFSKGISYMTPAQEERQLKKVKQMLLSRESSGSAQFDRIPIPPAEAASINRQLESIEAWLQTDEEALNLPPANSFIRRLLYQEIQAKFNDKVACNTKGATRQDSFIEVTRTDKQTKQKLAEDQRKKLEDEISAAVGFRHVLDSLRASRVPILLFNGILDLCLLLHQFYSPLPDNLEDFKVLAQKIFPVVVDTRHLIDLPLVSGSLNLVVYNLSSIVKALVAPPSVDIRTMFLFPAPFDKYNNDKEVLHEAGYDAFLTAVLMLACVHRVTCAEFPLTRELMDQCVAQWGSKMQMHNMFGVQYLNLAGEDKQPDLPHVFHISNFPSTWRLHDLQKVFANFGQTFVTFASSGTAFVSLVDKSKAEEVVSTLVSNSDSNETYRIISHATFWQQEQERKQIMKLTRMESVHGPNDADSSFSQSLDDSHADLKRPRLSPENSMTQEA